MKTRIVLALAVTFATSLLAQTTANKSTLTLAGAEQIISAATVGQSGSTLPAA